jgi:hypothetical protein
LKSRAHLAATKRVIVVAHIIITLSCQGEPGQDGADGAAGNKGDQGDAAITSVEAVAPGEECLAGGTRVSAGLDDNSDGELSADEVDTSAVICRSTEDACPVVEGEIVATTSADLRALEGCSTIKGGLTLDGSWLTQVPWLSELRDIDGYLDVRAPNLASLTGMGSLETVSGNLSIYGTSSLENIDELVRINDVGALIVSGNPGLISIGDMSSLRRAGAIVIDGNTSLVSLGRFEDLTVDTEIFVNNNPALTNLDALSGVVYAGVLRVSNNPIVRQCEAEAHAARLGVTCECANNSSEPCP